MTRIGEKELVLPALYLMYVNKNRKITITFLIKELTKILQPDNKMI